MPVQFTYDEMWWSFYVDASEDAKKELLEQIDRILKSVSSRVRKEILKDAPEDVLERYTIPTQPKPNLPQLRKELRKYIR